MKKVSIFLISLFFWQVSIAQVTDAEDKLKKQNVDSVEGWKIGGLVSVNVAQNTLKNWAAGGTESFAVNGIFSIFANYKKDKIAWDNSFDVGYGLLRQGRKGNSFMKTDDRIDFLSKFGREAFKNFYYAGVFNFKTQMAPGYNYPNDSVKISDFLAPAYLIEAIGLDYKPNGYFSLFAAPFTGKQTIVNSQFLANAGAFGVEPASFDSIGNMTKAGKRVLSEFGGYIRIIYSRNDFKSELLKNISFTTKVDLFSNYLKDPQNIVVNWETQIVLKVNKYISILLKTHLIYDDKIKIAVDNNKDGIIDGYGPRTQFKEILGVGFLYKF